MSIYHGYCVQGTIAAVLYSQVGIGYAMGRVCVKIPCYGVLYTMCMALEYNNMCSWITFVDRGIQYSMVKGSNYYR